MSKPEIEAQQMTGKEIVNMVLIHPFTLNFTEPMVFLLNLYIALIYGLLYLWFEAFPIVFIEIHGFTLGQSGLAYLGILIGALVVIPPFFWYLHKYTEPAFDENGELQPEKRYVKSSMPRKTCLRSTAKGTRCGVGYQIIDSRHPVSESVAHPF